MISRSKKLDIVSGGGAFVGNTLIEDARIEINQRGNGDRYAYIDFVGDDTYTDYGLRILRSSLGANSKSQIVHRGTGYLEIFPREGAPTVFTNTNVGIGTSNPTEKLDVRGNVVISGTCTSEGVDCAQDIAEVMHSTESASNTKCVPEDEINDEICTEEDDYAYGGKTKTCISKENLDTLHSSGGVICTLDLEFDLEFESGDVICADPDNPLRIKFCDGAYDKTVLSVVNYEATQIIGQRAPYPVSLAGVVPVKVKCDDAIKPGDALVSADTDGYAQKWIVHSSPGNVCKKQCGVEFKQCVKNNKEQCTPKFRDCIYTCDENSIDEEDLTERNFGTIFAKALESCDSGEGVIKALLT